MFRSAGIVGRARRAAASATSKTGAGAFARPTAPRCASLAAGALLAAALCAGGGSAEPARETGAAPQFGSFGVDLTAMDKSVRPGDDFFAFANGNWLRNTVIPPDRPNTGVDVDIQILTEQRLAGIVAALAARPYDGLSEDERKLRDFYDALLDRQAIDAAGLAPAKKTLDAIAGLETHADVAAALGRPELAVAGPLMMSMEIDFKNSGRYAVSVRQGDLPIDREYFLRDETEVAQVRDAYRRHLAQMLALIGARDSERRAAALYDLESKLAAAQWSNVENRDPDKLYNPMSLSALKALAPQFPWDAYIDASGIPQSGPRRDRHTGEREAEARQAEERQVIVWQLSAIPKLAGIFAETPVAVWRDYLAVHYLDAYAACLPKAFDDANFAFFGTALQGRTQQLPRSARAAELLEAEMGFGLGKLYVEKYFTPQARAKIVSLVDNLREVYDAEIRTVPWMSETTRARALDKLHRMALRIGYPARWRDYSALAIRRDDPVGNVARAKAFEWQRKLARLDGAVDRDEWDEPPQTVNAAYEVSTNALTLFAPFLQPPYFDPQADDAVNYGAIGALIGHEISHAFDDDGSKFDASGALNSWWTPADRQAYDAKARMLGAQYDAYQPLPGLSVNSALTMGENFADNAGLAVALKAYHRSLGGRPAPVLDGYTGDQRFFLAFAQIYRGKERTEALRQRLLSDVHAPDAYRVIGATRNQDAWYAAFDVRPGDKYYLPPEQRVRIW
jgi:putative endopeptidase